MEIKIKLNLGRNGRRSNIPARTMGTTGRCIPPSAGLSRSVYPPNRVRPVAAGRPSWVMTVKADELLEEEIKKWKDDREVR